MLFPAVIGLEGDGTSQKQYTMGALDGPPPPPPQCRLLILRNGNVPCRYFRNVPVDF